MRGRESNEKEYDLCVGYGIKGGDQEYVKKTMKRAKI